MPCHGAILSPAVVPGQQLRKPGGAAPRLPVIRQQHGGRSSQWASPCPRQPCGPALAPELRSSAALSRSCAVHVAAAGSPASAGAEGSRRGPTRFDPPGPLGLRHRTWSVAGGADAASPGGPSSSSASASASSSSSTGSGSSSRDGGNAGVLQLAAAVGAMAVVTAVCAASLGQGPQGLVAALSKSGFAAAFSLIFVSEIGDKTFFIAALLAMRHSKSIVLAGSVSALGLMSVISAVIGRLFREVPAQLKTSIPVGEYLACALLVWFGVSSIRSALALPVAPAAEAAPAAAGQGAKAAGEEEEGGELAEAREYLDKATEGHKVSTPLAAFWETFSLVFLAEWGDRSMLATIALGAAQSPVGVALGATWGHLLATAIAVLGGALLSQHISERTVGLIGGVLFLVFAVATLMGYV